jgi:hypothetical protein
MKNIIIIMWKLILALQFCTLIFYVYILSGINKMIIGHNVGKILNFKSNVLVKYIFVHNPSLWMGCQNI